MTSESVREIRPSVPIWRQWNLISNFGRRDLKAKFNGTLLGWAWSLVVPLATLAIYTLVFSIVFRMVPPPMGNGNEGIFVVWLFCGLVLWSYFSSCVNGGMGALLGSGPLLQKIYFPAYAPVLGAGLAVGIQSLIELGILAIVLVVLLNVSWTWLLVPLVLALFVIFTASVATIVSVMNVYYRDLAHLVSVALQLLFYLTPIIYNPEIVPLSWNGIPLRAIVEFSPLSQFVELFRAAIYDLTTGDLSTWISVTIWTVVALAGAMFVMKRRGGDLSEAL
ncbi:ABC transporter permease [Occultella kanbiaonis]|uniref:ABC transporter permease n=1 Tax=Occultella kanbiaonis TaxID=2675754 RepID=UPI0012B74BDF|nr:ABC transporter permease [Occultella kanbiaonis]